MEKIPSILALIFLFVSPNINAQAVVFTAKVIGVADGDTIKVLKNNRPLKIRLFGVDCPERAQAYGRKAKDFTTKLVVQKIVKIKVITKDKYGRTVAEVYTQDGRSLEHELLKAGYAWWFKRYAPKAKLLSYLQDQAKAQKKGLWSAANPLAPWAFRQLSRAHQLAPRGHIPPKHLDKASTILHGNTRSKVVHSAYCAHYNCKRCTRKFNSLSDAQKEGYHPHRECIRAYKKAKTKK